MARIVDQALLGGPSATTAARTVIPPTASAAASAAPASMTGAWAFVDAPAAATALRGPAGLGPAAVRTLLAVRSGR
ncbi:hypothetical protein OH805_18095 [Streptomyces sp. NBC_00879]|uniref:hypothetical protein n=1 Tax=Streptomyces sp. NBC_00879 TaxID=2975855 RepID=UPI003867BED8|nr:hypothetical protein OH805_18095 [Streptomyces sp. NBC_00879]